MQKPPEVVGRPFVTGDNAEHSSSVKGFGERQAAIRSTRYLAKPVQTLGTSLIAYGSSPKPMTYISSVRKQTAYDRRMKTGKGFQKPYTDSAGRKFTRGLGKESPISQRHGYRTGSRSSRHKPRVRSRTAVAAGGTLRGIGRVLPIVGYGYAFYTLVDEDGNVEQRAIDETSRAFDLERSAEAAEQIGNQAQGFAKRAYGVYSTYSPTAIAGRAVSTGIQKFGEAIASLKR